MTRAVLYARLSSDRYKGTADEGVKVEQQLAECRAHAQSRGWEVTAEFYDNDTSATTGVKRQGFEDLLSHVLAGHADTIVCWHTDRLARLSKDLERVITLDIPVYGLHAGHLDLSTPAGRAVARTVTAWAQYEGEQKAARFALATERRIQRGEAWWPSAPMGFNKDQTHSEDAAIVWEAYDSLLAGHTLGSIAREWNESGITTPKGSRWYGTTVRELLRAPRNAGLLHHKGEIIGPAAWEPLVDMETWDAAQAVLARPERHSGGNRRLTYMLSGLAECGTCLDGTTVWAASTKNGKRRYGCKTRSHNTRQGEAVDRFVIENTVWLLTRPGAGVLAEDSRAPERNALIAERGQLAVRLSELEKSVALGDLDTPSFLRIKATIDGRLAEIEGQVQDATRAALFDGLLGWDWSDEHSRETAITRFTVLPVQRRQEVLRALWARIVLMPVKPNAKTSIIESVRMVSHELLAQVPDVGLNPPWSA